MLIEAYHQRDRTSGQKFSGCRLRVEAVRKRDRAKEAQNCFLNCLLPTEVASAIGFRIDEIETEILHAS
jgi:hypothetical protein